MLLRLYKYHGAGNDFLLADNREGRLSLPTEQIRHLCDRHTGFGADGLMLLESSGTQAFRMLFYNPDGSHGMMCGNGGRCIVSFAVDLGVVPAEGMITFEAPDGPHKAEILPVAESIGASAYTQRIIRLKMKDVTGLRVWPDEQSCFLDTGARHLVRFVQDLAGYPVFSEGGVLRHDPRFAPEGTNVDFVELLKEDGGNLLAVRTFEKGVEDETLACGTGIVASAIAAYSFGLLGRGGNDGEVSCKVRTAIAELLVGFKAAPETLPFSASDVWLTGPAVFIGTVEIML